MDRRKATVIVFALMSSGSGAWAQDSRQPCRQDLDFCNFSQSTMAIADWLPYQAFYFPTKASDSKVELKGDISGNQPPGTLHALTYTGTAPVPHGAWVAATALFATYSPTTHGRIRGVTFQEVLEIANPNSNSTNPQKVYALVVQSGKYYAAEVGEISKSDKGQKTLGKYLDAVAFGEIRDGASIPDVSSHPNFSTSGGPIRFGFARMSQLNAGTAGTFSWIHRWSVQIEHDLPNKPTLPLPSKPSGIEVK